MSKVSVGVRVGEVVFKDKVAGLLIIHLIPLTLSLCSSRWTWWAKIWSLFRNRGILAAAVETAKGRAEWKYSSLTRALYTEVT